MNKDQLKRILSDIRFWILFFFLLRLVGITNAPLEIGHNWRQTLTAMIARNFYYGSPDILYPRIDMDGNQSGIIGCEFPLLNYLIYLVSLVFDYAHWYGRLINLIVSSIGIYHFYLLVEKISTKKIAFNSAIVLLCSIWFTFSRKIMPDTFSVSLVLMGLYYGYTYLTGSKFKDLLLFFLFITLGLLSKIPALCLVSPVGLVLLTKEITQDRKIKIVAATFLSLVISFSWYYIWVPILVERYHYQTIFPKGLIEGAKEIAQNLPALFERFYNDSFRSYIALPFFALGTFLFFRKNNIYLKAGVSVISILFFLFILKTGFLFPLHSYYIIPFIPVMALLAGYGIDKVPLKYQFIPLLLISAEGIANQHHDFFIKDKEKYMLTLENIISTRIKPNDLIVINGGQSPQELYFANRKGWTVDNNLINQKSLDSLHSLGASYMIIIRRSSQVTFDCYGNVYSDENYRIYDLK